MLLVSALLALGSSRSSTLPSPTDLVRQIYGQTPQLVVYLTGGGTQIVPWMLATPGASQSVLDIQVPYSQLALAQLLGAHPDRCCVPEVARQMAVAAYTRALQLRDRTEESKQQPCVGLGCTAALRSLKGRRGEHRCYIAICTQHGVHELSLLLAKGARSRELEDEVVARCALLGLAGATCDAKVKENARYFWCLSPSGGNAEHHPVLKGARSRLASAEKKGVGSLGATPIAVEELRWHFSEHATPLSG